MNFLSVKKEKIIFLVAFVVTMLGYSHNIKAQNSRVDSVLTDTTFVEPVAIQVHSPHKATFYSAIMPGLGQAYNKKYWKMPIVYAAFGGVIYGIAFNTKYYNRYRRAHRDILLQDPGNTYYLHEDMRPGGINSEEEMIAFLSSPSNAQWYETALKNKKQYYKKYRDLSYIGLGLVYVLNLVDASVDAHFKTFDVSNDLSMHFEPTVKPLYGGYSSVGLQVRFTF